MFIVRLDPCGAVIISIAARCFVVGRIAFCDQAQVMDSCSSPIPTKRRWRSASPPDLGLEEMSTPEMLKNPNQAWSWAHWLDAGDAG